MMNTYNDLAMQLGTTTQAVASSAAEWLRQGYSVSEANELIKSSTYLSRLGFMDMNQSVTALTSVMKGFRIEATDSMDIVDKLTQLDAKYATTAGDIATALSRTSAVAREAGLDLDQTAAALTTMIDVSQQDAHQFFPNISPSSAIPPFEEPTFSSQKFHIKLVSSFICNVSNCIHRLLVISNGLF